MSEIASSKATGGKGPAFEFKVQAAFLVTMLVNGRYPCLPEGTAQFVRFQARQVGYRTDDLFVQMRTPSGTVHRLLAQVKAEITFTKGSKEFRETLIAAWADFTNAEMFDRDKDVLLIVSGPGSKGEIRHFRPLLNMSRSSLSAEEYFTKISTPNFVSEDMRRYLAAIERLLKEHLGAEPGRNELWQFLKAHDGIRVG